jgi:SAM-dependent methyltransferase
MSGRPERAASVSNRWCDPGYLARDQYRDASNLAARIQIYRFGSNPSGWYQWLFDHFRVRAGGMVLEIGCGSAALWKANLDDVPSEWHITLSDLSPGMLAEARATLGDTGDRFTFTCFNAQNIPFPANSFDAVIAIHMLFHVPNRQRAIRDVRRVLRPGGRFYASTVGEGHLAELHAALRRFRAPDTPAFTPDFTLESGGDELAASFEYVAVDRYEDVLRIPEVAPLLAYVDSGGPNLALADDARTEFTRWACAEIAEHGHVRISTSQGLFEAC